MALLVGFWVFLMNFMDMLPVYLLPKLASLVGVDHLRIVPSTDPNVAINRILSEFTVRPAGGGSGLDLFAEPWAIGGNSYQLGGFPQGWSEWNGRYRDQMRQAQNELGMIAVSIGQEATDFTGSSDLFQGSGRAPWNSTNFIDVHDGMTLKDVYSCNGSNNGQAWPWGPSDGGTSTNYSWDQGGNAFDQRRAARTGMAFEMLSAGTPLLQGGDELCLDLGNIGRTLLFKPRQSLLDEVNEFLI